MWSVVLWALACVTEADIEERLDPDGDGFYAEEDCDNENAEVFPGALERCNGLDDDCDGEVDGPSSVDAISGFVDADGDGFGEVETAACAESEGFSLVSGDCDDADVNVHPAAEERCGNGLDDDCDPLTSCRLLGALDVDDAGAVRVSLSVPAQHLTAGRFSGAAADDAIVVDTNGQLVVLRGGQDGGLDPDPVASLQLGSAPVVLARPADLDEDGRAELIVGRPDAGVVALWWGSASGAVAATPDVEIDGWSAPGTGSTSPIVAVPPSSGAAPVLLIADATSGLASVKGLSVTRGQPLLALADAPIHLAVGTEPLAPYVIADGLGAETQELLLVAPPRATSSLARWVPWAGANTDGFDARGAAWLRPSEGVFLLLPDQQGDVDGDGALDLVVALTGGDFHPQRRVALLRSPLTAGQVDLTLAPGLVGSAPQRTLLGVAMPDLDQDGLSDLALLEHAAGRTWLRVAYGPGPTGQLDFNAFDLVLDLGAATESTGLLATGDVDGDGYRDVLIALPTAELVVLAGRGT